MPTHNSDQMLLECCFCCLGKHFSHFMEKEEEEKNTVYIYIGDSKLCCLLYWTGLNWYMDYFGRATCTVHLISAQNSPEGVNCTKGKKLLSSYCLFYKLWRKKDNHSLAITELSWKRKFKWDFAVFSANSQEQIDHGAISKEMAASALLEKRLMIYFFVSFIPTRLKKLKKRSLSRSFSFFIL